MNIVIIGICGKMGTLIYEYLKNSNRIYGIDIKKHNDIPTYNSLDEIENIDIIIDFSSVNSYNHLLDGIKRRIPVFSGTTGYSKEKIDKLYNLAKEYNTIFIWKPNYAKGIKLFSSILKECKDEFNILDFIEIHEKTKKDAPSGTSIMLAEILGIDKVNIQSIRLNFTPAIHELIFYSDSERITLKHEIFDKKAFILGLIEEINKFGVDQNVRNII